MAVKQISVFLENKPGTLQELTDALAGSKVNIRALSLAETKDFGIARIIADDAFEASNVLKSAGFVSSLTPVLAVEIPDEVGALAKVLKVFNEGNINIEYMYAFLPARDRGGACMIFRVNDIKDAEAFLRSKELSLLDQDDMVRISG